MNRYQIGRISGTWVNFTPPIRGGLFRHVSHNESFSLADSITMNRDKELRPGSIKLSPSVSSDRTVKPTCPQHSVDNALAVQRALDDDLKYYPSIDRETQQEIVKKYRELHSRVKTEGYYNCHCQEYAREILRYVTIFAVFSLCLRSGWYVTSAVFLGLFWVCPHRDAVKDCQLTLSG